MIRNTSIGFEYQMNQLNVCEKRTYMGSDTAHYVSYYPTKVLFNIHEDALRVYGDRSQEDFELECYRFNVSLVERHIVVLRITDSKKETVDLLVDKDFQEFFNEAEFLITYPTPDPRPIPLTETAILEWIFSNVQRSTRELRDYFKTLRKRSIVSVLGSHSREDHSVRQRRRKDFRNEFPYSQIYIDPDHSDFCFFGRFDLPSDKWPMRYQTTIGLELKDVLSVLRVLQDAYMKAPKKGVSEYSQAAVRALPESEKEVRALISPEQHPFLYGVACLIRYMDKTARIRKHSLFVVRHYQRDLVSLLSPEEAVFLVAKDPRFRVPLTHRQRYQKILKQTDGDPVGRKRSIQQLNGLQNMDQTGTFAVQSRREQTRILVEIRMIDMLGRARLKSRKRTVHQLQRGLDEFSASVTELLSKRLRMS